MSAGPRAMLALALLASLAGGCATSPVRYHYPRNSGEVDGTVDRLDLTVTCAEDEGAAEASHRTARRAIKLARAALDQDPLDIPAMAAALDEAARALDLTAVEARAAQRGVKPAPVPEGRSEVRWDPMAQRDRLFDLEYQARRAAREVRALRRAVAGPPSGEG